MEGQPALSRTNNGMSAGFTRTSYQNGAAVTLQMAQSSTPEAASGAWMLYDGDESATP
jgi:hypothetical protein